MCCTPSVVTYVFVLFVNVGAGLQGTFLPSKVGPWHFDKRDYNGAIPRNLTRPPKGSAQASVQFSYAHSSYSYSTSVLVCCSVASFFMHVPH